MKRKAHKLRKAAINPPNRGRGIKRWKNCEDMRCPLEHPNNTSPENPGPPGIKKPKMNRTRPVRNP